MISKEELYPFPPDVPRKHIFGWWEAIPAKLLGKKYHEYNAGYEMIAYYYKGKVYITKFGKLIG